ncbi:MAG: hypothetical protein QM586_12480 [Xenophilus sp.]
MKLPRAVLLFLPFLLGAALAAAQAPGDAGAGQDFQAERERIGAERRAIEERFQQQQAACYQRFAVNDCLAGARSTRRAANDDLKRQEAVINDIERKRRSAEQLRQIDERQANPRPQDRPEEQEKARQAQQAREQQAASRASSRASMAADEEKKRQAFADKQHRFSESRARAARKRAQEPTERRQFEAKQRSVQERRAALERKNAQRTKPPAAPLPAR